ncbi:MAG: ABC transporter ATP-binding protein [Lautropia sp.]
MSLSLTDARLTFNAGTADARPALDGVSLDVRAAEFVVVIGSNGAGKSTLLNVVSGQLQLDSGTVRIDGDDVTRQPEHRRAALIARVAQDPMRGTLPAMTIEENLALADLRRHGRGLAPALTAARRERFRATLAGFGLGLESRLGNRAGALSGGQRQVLALAMAVLNPPRVLLLDEHTAALDPRTAELVLQATLRSVRDGRLTTLMVTHNMQHAIAFGDRLIMMDSGRIRLDIAGDQKRGLTVAALVERFHLADDKLLLAS